MKTGVRMLFTLLMIAPLALAVDPPINNYIRDLLNFYLPTSTGAGQCKIDSDAYVAGVLAGQPWAQQMFDASAKVPDTGLMQGSVYDLGNFDECLFDFDEDALIFLPQYCLVDVTLDLTAESILQPLVEQSRKQRWGFCIPKSCSPEDISSQIKSKLDVLLGETGTSIVAVGNGNCRGREDDRDYMDGGDITVVVILCLLVVLVIAATIVDYQDVRTGNEKHSGASTGKVALLAFSAYTNGRNLISLKRNKATMNSVNGIRWLSMMWVVIGHRYTKEQELPRINKTDVLDGLMYDWSQMIITSGNIAVDTFFVLSGMLVCFIFMRNMDKTKKFNVVEFYLYRYIRLTPPVVLVVLIYARVLLHTSIGPLWQEVIGQQEVNCKNNWWTNILYINNYVYPRSDQQCVSQTWYLSVDMQFFWFTPLLLYPLWRWPRIGYGMIAILTVLGIFSPFYITYANEFPWTTVWNTPPETKQSYFVNIYTQAYARTQPYIVGIVLGLIMHKLRTRKLNLKPIHVAIGWFLAAAIALSVMFTLTIYYKPDYKYNVWDAAFYAGFHRLGWSLAVAWVIFACEKGYGGPVNSILSWKYFQPLSRLSYCAYLTHMIILLSDLGTVRYTGFYSHWSTVYTLVGDYFFVLLVAAMVSFTSEMPMLTLEKLIFKKTPPPPPKKVEAVKNDVEAGPTDKPALS